MTRTKWLTSLGIAGLLLILGAALFLFNFKQKLQKEIDLNLPEATKADSAAIQTPPAQPDFKAALPMKRVMDLYERESKRVGQIDADPAATQKRLEENARELTAGEIAWLAAQATDIKNDPDARFFAAFLLGLSHRLESVEALHQIAVSPVPKSRNDRWVEQERAFRASAIEGFCHSCAEFPKEVKDAALDVTSRQQDEFLGDRAHRCLFACQQGKKIEEQDEEALEKLRSKK